MRNYKGPRIRLPRTSYAERMKAYGYEDTEDFKMRLRVMFGRPAIVSNAPRQRLTTRRTTRSEPTEDPPTQMP